MTTTFTPATFSNAKQFKSATYPWKLYKPSPEEVRRFSWGILYKSPAAFAAPVENPKKTNSRGVQQHRAFLEQAYGVDGASSANTMIESLLRGQDHPTNDFLLPLLEIYLQFDPDKREDFKKACHSFIEDVFRVRDLDPSTMQGTFRHFTRVVEGDNFAAAHAPAIPTTTRAWDIIRVHNVGGPAVEADWVNQDEFLTISDRAVEALQHHFVSWADVAGSYWWGRFLWACDTETDVISAMGTYTQKLAELLAHEESPWVRVPLHENKNDSASNLLGYPPLS